jgi:ribosome-binding protein aMBF1 (putative translation factor)
MMITTCQRCAQKVGTYLVDNEVHVARRDHLSVEQVLLVADTANRPAGSLDCHHLLNHFFFVRVKEARELRGVE